MSGVGTSTVHWGIPAVTDNSGLSFAGAQPPLLGVNPGDIFKLGTLTHFNQPIQGGTAASAATLDVVLNTDAGTQTFTFGFGIDETPNALPCAYPSVTPCADAIFLPSSFSSAVITVGGVNYHLQILGFGQTSSSIDTRFVSQEGGNNSEFLWATLTETEITAPEPASIALLGAGLLTLTGMMRKKSR